MNGFYLYLNLQLLSSRKIKDWVKMHLKEHLYREQVEEMRIEWVVSIFCCCLLVLVPLDLIRWIFPHHLFGKNQEKKRWNDCYRKEYCIRVREKEKDRTHARKLQIGSTFLAFPSSFTIKLSSEMEWIAELTNKINQLTGLRQVD